MKYDRWKKTVKTKTKKRCAARQEKTPGIEMSKMSYVNLKVVENDNKHVPENIEIPTIQEKYLVSIIWRL